MLFFDPILSSNNIRSCASCHKPEAFFTEQTVATSLQIDSSKRLTRNTPSLINADYNHLLMLDGAHYTLQHQTVGVITNPKEMGGNAATVIKKIMSCKEYKKSFTALLAYTPQEKEITLEHIASAITYYYSKFSKGTSSFDKSMNNIETATPEVVNGFNLFMGKAQCATCHFVPQFNGVKPPYVGSEFEVLGVPADMHYTRVSPDSGRYLVNPAKETFRAFRTGSLRNIAHTMPYMHNGVFKTLDEVVDFYNAGGGVGHGLLVPNQTLSADSLHLTAIEKKQLIKFMESLDENVPTESKPQSLPISSLKSIRKRVLGGIY
jgi:cytochrome c peroxidase